MPQRKFSTVEMTVLGMTWLRGPCTTYTVMKELSSSASTFHKSRAGTAYSVVKRLQKVGLISELDGQIQVTPVGEAELRRWLGPDVPMMDVAHSADFLRLRFFFLGALPKKDRLAFIDKSAASLQEFLIRCEDLISKNEDIRDYFGVLATVSVVLETKARIEWLRIVRKWVESPMPDDGRWAETVMSELLNHNSGNA